MSSLVLELDPEAITLIDLAGETTEPRSSSPTIATPAGTEIGSVSKYVPVLTKIVAGPKI